jgi:succinate dehydrogenase/fumarate reductase flavoprotein subunit
VLVGEIAGKSALMREESRGGHHRDDFPDRDDENWVKTIIVRNDNGKVDLSTFVIDKEWKDRPEDLGTGWWG